MNVFKSYIDLFGHETTNDLFAQPITNKKFKILKNIQNKSLLKDRLNAYQLNIGKPIEEWCKNFSKQYESLHESS